MTRALIVALFFESAAEFRGDLIDARLQAFLAVEAVPIVQCLRPRPQTIRPTDANAYGRLDHHLGRLARGINLGDPHRSDRRSRLLKLLKSLLPPRGQGRKGTFGLPQDRFGFRPAADRLTPRGGPRRVDGQASTRSRMAFTNSSGTNSSPKKHGPRSAPAGLEIVARWPAPFPDNRLAILVTPVAGGLSKGELRMGLSTSRDSLISPQAVLKPAFQIAVTLSERSFQCPHLLQNPRLILPSSHGLHPFFNHFQPAVGDLQHSMERSIIRKIDG